MYFIQELETTSGLGLECPLVKVSVWFGFAADAHLQNLTPNASGDRRLAAASTLTIPYKHRTL